VRENREIGVLWLHGHAAIDGDDLAGVDSFPVTGLNEGDSEDIVHGFHYALR